MSHFHDFKDLGMKGHDHHMKVGGWVKGEKLVCHKPGFYKDHLAGTFHHLGGHDSAISLPSDHIATLKLLP